MTSAESHTSPSTSPATAAPTAVTGAPDAPFAGALLHVPGSAPFDAPFAEIVVNIPMRRPFNAAANPPAGEGADEPEEPSFQTFTYSVPEALRGRLCLGHLVWVPFGNRVVQGIVTGQCEETDVRTRPISGLAHEEPVLTPAQLMLALWVAHESVASMAEAVRLLLPPGMLLRSPDKLGVRIRRELLIEQCVSLEEGEAALEQMASETPAARLMRWFVLQPDAHVAAERLCADCGLADRSALDRLLAKGKLIEEQGVVRLGVAPAHLPAEFDRARRLGGTRAVLAALQQAGGVLWRPELYRTVETDLAELRRLQEAGLLSLREAPYFRDPLRGRSFGQSVAPNFSGEQAAAWEILAREGIGRLRTPGAFAGDGQAARFLLFGVTGSGKTEIYLRAIAETLALGRQAIVLVPEIALAPQTVRRVAGRFPGRVTVIHSEMSTGERYDVWRALRQGDFDVVVGPRSALFAPLPRLGLIVIDEEHESSYKQDSEAWGSFTIFYDARRVAQRLASLTGSVLLCGSATPSLEIYSEAMRGRVHLLSLGRRVATLPGEVSALPGALENGVAPEPHLRYGTLPPVEIVDMRQELRAGNRSIFSRSLQSELHAALDAREQVILFLNRRGTHTVIMCRDCGHVSQCENCQAPLVYHEREGGLRCHHCGRREEVPQRCPQCGKARIKFFGSGTEQIEQRVHEISPRARILRWDADTTTGKGSHERILERFAAHDADVLVGTQMIAKGLDLPLVTLVGVVSADVGLHLPDFRAAERTFQLLTQVAGRAGRSSRGGRVVIQSYTPSHYAIQAAAQHDYQRFYEYEMAFRREQEYPPVRRMARLVLWEKDAARAQAEAVRLAAELRWVLNEMGQTHAARIFGPVAPFFARAKGYFRRQILLSHADPAAVVRRLHVPMGWRIDIDPVTVL